MIWLRKRVYRLGIWKVCCCCVWLRGCFSVCCSGIIVVVMNC